MTMAEKLRIHAEIEAADRQHRDDYLMEQAYEKMTDGEIRAMLEEMDARMEWNEQFGFLMALLLRKTNQMQY